MQEELPKMALDSLEIMFDQLDDINARIINCEEKMLQPTKESEEAERFQTVPGVGPITAFAMLAFAGDLDQFKNGHEFAAWIGLMPRQHSTGGKQQLEASQKGEQRDQLHRLVQGAMTQVRHQQSKFKELSPRTQRLFDNKPKKLVAVAMANKTARILWSLHAHQTTYDLKLTIGIKEKLRHDLNSKPTCLTKSLEKDCKLRKEEDRKDAIGEP